MLVDLRDRLRTQGELPDLPPGWGAELSVLSAYGDSFSGDFVVTSKTGDVLEIVLVDVSGKGIAAGTRSLLLSGAFGGLLGSMPVDRFLPAANSYLMRQHWDEGFATAAHAYVNLRTGEFSIGSAGHPPAVRFSAGSGRWEVFEGEEGPVLGVTEASASPGPVASSGGATPCCSTPTASSRPATATCATASTGCWGPRSR